jgi:hypothetical protein
MAFPSRKKFHSLVWKESSYNVFWKYLKLKSDMRKGREEEELKNLLLDDISSEAS